MIRLAMVTVLAAGVILGGCGKDPKAPIAGDGNAEHGRQVYLAQCITCHNADPSKAGPLGPPVKGVSRDLLEARVVRGAYPPGYKPQRDSAIMQPMPHLATAIPDLAAYLK